MLAPMTRKPDDALAPVTLIAGPETLLADRAVAAVVAAARQVDPSADVSEVTASALRAAGLAELISPSLFASRRVVVVRDIQDAGDDLATALVDYIRDPASDIHLVLVHAGGVKGKRLVDGLRKAGARQVACDKITRPDDLMAFVQAEVRAARGRIDDLAARQLVEAVGGDLRALAAAAAQLTADSGGHVTSGVVGTYFEGHAEVKGWSVADKAVNGQVAEALQELNWALQTGTAPVMIVGSLASALRPLAKLSGVRRGVRDADVARDLGVPPWKVRVLRAQLRGWTPAGLAAAIQAVARADLNVKGASHDANLALTRAIVDIGRARAFRG